MELRQDLVEWNYHLALFSDAPPGHTLVTFDNFAAAPGLIFYNVLGSTDSLEAVAVGAAIGAAAAEAFLAVGGLPGLAASGQAIGQLAYAAAQAANAVGSAVLAGLDSEVAGTALAGAYSSHTSTNGPGSCTAE